MMRKIFSTFSIFFTLMIFFVFSLPVSYAQEISASPLEGRWVWNGEGEAPDYYDEIIFLGNVALAKLNEFDETAYFADTFTYTNESVVFLYDQEEIYYRLSGSTLFITIDNETFIYTKAALDKSPLEGIWLTDSSDYNDDMKLVFVGNIMALTIAGVGIGMPFTYSPTDLYWMYERLAYKRAGNSLTLTSSDGEVIVGEKIY
jgi:hypothetical protein